MNAPAWHERFATGNATVDEQHRKLIELVEAVEESCAHGTNTAEVSHFIDAFRDHVLEHFRDEEQEMARIGYPELPVHQRAHEDICAMVLGMVSASDRGEVVLPASAQALGHVLLRHMQGEDMRLVAFIRAKGGREV
jgi:hemerythrin-like metal-binding protein